MRNSVLTVYRSTYLPKYMFGVTAHGSIGRVRLLLLVLDFCIVRWRREKICDLRVYGRIIFKIITQILCEDVDWVYLAHERKPW
jgi:hypothetical protein